MIGFGDGLVNDYTEGFTVYKGVCDTSEGRFL